MPGSSRGIDVIRRAFEIAQSTLPRAPRDRLAHPFGIGLHEVHQWRVSRDVWEELVTHGESCGGALHRNPMPDDRLLGEGIVVDESLPPQTMLLEPVK